MNKSKKVVWKYNVILKKSTSRKHFNSIVGKKENEKNLLRNYWFQSNTVSQEKKMLTIIHP